MSFLRSIQRASFFRSRGYAATAAPAPNATQKPKKGAQEPAIPQSSCTAETVLTGVNYLKGQPPVLALPDEQYPEWLWTILQPKVFLEDGPGGKAERVRRKMENQRLIKDRNFMSTQ